MSLFAERPPRKPAPEDLGAEIGIVIDPEAFADPVSQVPVDPQIGAPPAALPAEPGGFSEATMRLCARIAAEETARIFRPDIELGQEAATGARLPVDYFEIDLASAGTTEVGGPCRCVAVLNGGDPKATLRLHTYGGQTLDVAASPGLCLADLAIARVQVVVPAGLAGGPMRVATSVIPNAFRSSCCFAQVRASANVEGVPVADPGDPVPLSSDLRGRLVVTQGEYGNVVHHQYNLGVGGIAVLDVALGAGILWDLFVENGGANNMAVGPDGGAAGTGVHVAAATFQHFAFSGRLLTSDIQISSVAGANPVEVFANISAVTHKGRY